ncbi:unnamed protein product [Gordionus sp. m RMFG-2023]
MSSLTHDIPFAHVYIYNNTYTQKCRKEIEHFMIEKSKILANPITLKNTQSFKIPNNFINLESLKNHSVGNHNIIGNIKFFDNFSIDIMGDALYNFKDAQSQNWDLPDFEYIYYNPLGGLAEDLTVKAHNSRIGPKCFNCEGPHVLSTCLQKLDFKKIAKNKTEFMAKSINKNMTSRYHIDIEPRYTKYKPGLITSSLRKALGLHKYELPPYIYVMRTLGYPPGHLIDAKKETSGIILRNNSKENFKYDDTISIKSFDLNKIINYEGFNVSLNSKSIDEYKKFNSIPMQFHHSKLNWLEKFEHPSIHNVDIGDEGKKIDNVSIYSQVDNESRFVNIDPETIIDIDTTKIEHKNYSPLDNSINISMQEMSTNNKLDHTDIKTKNKYFKGTPIIASEKRLLNSIVHNNVIFQNLPSLEQFAVDIQPFSCDKEFQTFIPDAQNIMERKGIFEKFKQKLNCIKRKACKRL